MLNVTRNGTTAYHIVRTLQNLGFESYGVKKEKLEETEIPFIAHTIINGSYKHYMVVYEVSKKYVKIADPASRIKKISHDEFLKIWTGISIEMYPSEILPHEKPKNINKLFKINKIMIIKIGFISIFVTILSIITSFFFQSLIENNSIKKIIIFFMIIILFKTILEYIRRETIIKLTSDIEKNITKRVFKNIIKLPYRYYHNHTTGEVISKINDLIIFKDITLKLILTCFIDLPLSIVSGILLFLISKKLFVISLTLLTLYIFIIIIFRKKININISNILEKKSKINSFMTESISGFETVKGINIENKIINIFNKKYSDYIKNKINLNKITNKENLLKDVVSSLGMSLIIIIGILEVRKGVMSLSMLVTYNILSAFFLEPIKNIVDLDYEIKEAKNAFNRVLDLIEEKKEKTHEINGNIETHNLKFTLDNINYILNGIDISIKAKNKVLITGKSGSGKSTLLKLIKGYYKDYEGKILIGTQKINNPTNILYISNKETLFTGTINYNLTLKGSDKIKEKIKICEANEILEAYPLKEKTLLEEDGFNISNGQRQRLVLARSLHNFDVLLIDEGLSGVDTNLERKILKKMFKEYKDKTIIIISHRLDNLDLFDQFIKLDSGKVIISAAKR